MNFKSLFKSEFVRNVATLMTGTTISQAIPLAIAPILTRIFTPEDFGILALFLSITAIASITATGRYELAILLPKEEKEALNIVYLSSILTGTFSILLFLTVFFFNSQITELLDEPRIRFWLYLAPISVLFIGVYNALSAYNVRAKNYKGISNSMITKSVSQSVSQVGLGFLSTGAFGLIIGQIISYLSGNYVLYKKMVAQQSVKSTFDGLLVKAMARRYIRFPKMALPGNIMNSVALNAINFFISALFSTFILGQFTLASRILGVPSRILGSSISQVYFQKIADASNNCIDLMALFKKTLSRLILIAIPIFLIAFFSVEPIFGFVFGEEWRIAGTYAMIIVPLSAVRFVSSSLSTTLHVFERQDLTLVTNATLMITLFGLFGYANYANLNFISTLQLYSLIYSIEYAIFVGIYYWVVKKNNQV